MRICVREPLTANRTYYVRTDGNDSNTGLVNDASGAFLTIQKAVNVVSSDLDLATYSCVIQVGAGTYAENVRLREYLGTATPILRGDNTTPGNVVIAPASGESVTLDVPTKWRLQGFKITSNSHGIHVSAPGVLIIGNLEFGACPNGYHMAANFAGVIAVENNYSISGGGHGHMTSVSSGSMFWLDSRTITLTGTPHFIGAFVVAERASSVLANNMTFTGSATGVRYVVKSNAVIDTIGAGSNYFPGSSVAAPQSGGQYL